MTYDYYDYFTKQRNNEIFTETTNVMRQKLWRETFDVIESQEWEELTDRIRKGQ